MVAGHVDDGDAYRLDVQKAPDLMSTIDALRIYLLCLARPAAEARPPLQDVPTVKLYATAALSIFQRHLLTTSLWNALCAMQSPGILRPYAELVNAVAQLAGSLHGTSLITGTLVDVLEDALQGISVEHGSAIEAVRYTYIIASCRQVLQDTRTILDGKAALMSHNGVAGESSHSLVYVTAGRH